MDTRPRIVGNLADEIEETLEQADRAVNPPRRPMRPQRVFTEADETPNARPRVAPDVRRPQPQRAPIKQLPMHMTAAQEQARARANAYRANVQAAAPVAPSEPEELVDEQVIKELALDSARRIKKVTSDLLLGAAVVTASVAELTGNLISLLGLVLLLFPGQFVHTTLMALYQRATGRERDFGDAFSQNWKLYRNIPSTYGKIGSLEVGLSFVVGLGLVGPILLLKFLELVSTLIILFK